MAFYLKWKVNNRREGSEDKRNIQKRALCGVRLLWVFLIQISLTKVCPNVLCPNNLFLGKAAFYLVLSFCQALQHEKFVSVNKNPMR